MQKINLKFSVTPIQSFFIEKTNELLHRNTQDTYRLRLHNPTSLIRELVSVCGDLVSNKLKNYDYAYSLINETSRILSTNHSLKFENISEEYFHNLLQKSKKDDLHTVINAGRIVLKDNINYSNSLFKSIMKRILKKNHTSSLPFNEMKEFNLLLHYFYIELVSTGYSRFYLYRFTRTILFGYKEKTFNEKMLILKSLFSREPENYEVIFGLESPKMSLNSIQILDSNVERVDKQIRTQINIKASEEVSNFLNRKHNELLIRIRLKSLDYYRALDLARNEILRVLDILHISYSSMQISIMNEVCVIGENDPSKSKIFNNKFRIEGYYYNNKHLYKEIFDRYTKLTSNPDVSTDAKNKITSGLRFLRLGTDAKDLGNKLLNYWIGLEFLFSKYEADTYTIGRLKTYFKRCHGIIHFKRNINDFHKAIARFGLSESIQNYNDDHKYLLKETTYELIISRSNSQLMIYRAKFYLELLKDSKKLRGVLERHQQNLEWNLTRIYRIRNEIVHNAELKNDIAPIVGHLRYYLTFILNGVIQFFNDHSIDIDNDGELTIDDYFISNEIKLSSLERKKGQLNFNELLNIENPMEIIL